MFFSGNRVYYVHKDSSKICSTEYLFIANKFQNEVVTEQQIECIHTKYLTELDYRYQSQPQCYDEYIRSQFIMKLVSKYRLHCDGKMLWRAIPKAPINDKNIDVYAKNVLDVIESVYDYLSRHTIDVDIVSLLYILKQFMMHQLFRGCLKWLKKNSGRENREIKFVMFYQ